MKLWIIGDTMLLEYQVEVGIDINLLEIYPYFVQELPPEISDTNYKLVSINNFVYEYHAHDVYRRASWVTVKGYLVNLWVSHVGRTPEVGVRSQALYSYS